MVERSITDPCRIARPLRYALTDTAGPRRSAVRMDRFRPTDSNIIGQHLCGRLAAACRTGSCGDQRTGRFQPSGACRAASRPRLAGALPTLPYAVRPRGAPPSEVFDTASAQGSRRSISRPISRIRGPLYVTLCQPKGENLFARVAIGCAIVVRVSTSRIVCHLQLNQPATAPCHARHCTKSSTSQRSWC